MRPLSSKQSPDRIDAAVESERPLAPAREALSSARLALLIAILSGGLAFVATILALISLCYVWSMR